MTYIEGYRAGACNIGPREVARRRMTGHLGAAVTLATGAFLLWTDAAPWLRLALFLPASLSAAGYIQAATRFCADYGWRGVFNFGAAGRDRALGVQDAAARRADRAKALRIGLASGAVGLLVAVGAALL